jgi:DNA-binding MarR family transcriptional regulator
MRDITKPAAPGGPAPLHPSLDAGRRVRLDHFAPYLLNRISAHYTQDLEAALHPFGFSIVKLRTLVVLNVSDGLTINELADNAATRQSTMSRTVDALEAAGLVRRETESSDLRVRRVYITEAGAARLARTWPVMEKAFEGLFAGLTEDEYKRFVATLHKLLANLRAASL